MGEREKNLDQLRLAAFELKPLLGRVAFLGGCATGLYITDVGSADVRSTRDVDVIVEIANQAEYRAIETEMRNLGFTQPMEEEGPVCRWYKNHLVVDVMPTDPKILGFSNRWYPEAIKTSISTDIGKGVAIQVVTAPLFVATKIEAFEGRGQSDFYGSHDLEDLLAVIDGRETLAAEIRETKHEVRAFVAGRISAYMAQSDFMNALPGLITDYYASPSRAEIVLSRLDELANIDK